MVENPALGESKREPSQPASGTAQPAKTERQGKKQIPSEISINKASGELTASESIDYVITTAHRHVASHINPDLAVIFLREKGLLHSQGEKPKNPTFQKESPAEHRVGQCLCGLVAQTGQPIYATDIYADARCSLDECKKAGIRAFAALPIRMENEVLGVLGIGSFSERDFSLESSFLGMLSSYLAMGLKNARLYGQAQNYAESLTQRVRELERTQEALKQREATLKSIFTAAPVGIGLVSDRILKQVNNRICEMTGYARKELLEQSARMLYLSQEEFEYVGREKYRLISKQGTGTVETRWRRKDGGIIDVLLSSTPLDPNDLPAGVTFTALDITDRKQAERQREVLIAELEAKNAELEQFTYTVSHDLKSPLITIRGFLGMLKKNLAKRDEERIETDMKRIADAAVKMEQLLEDLLALSRIGRFTNPSEEVPFGELVREAVEIVKGDLEARGVAIEIAPGLPVVYGDHTRLRQVLQNLIDNAVKFMGAQQKPLIQVDVERKGNEDIFYVRDNGSGIDPKYHDKVFGLFDRLDHNVHGTGIGLAIVKRIVEFHGGRIWIDSKGQGQGSTFRFTLPRKDFGKKPQA